MPPECAREYERAKPRRNPEPDKAKQATDISAIQPDSVKENSEPRKGWGAHKGKQYIPELPHSCQLDQENLESQTEPEQSSEEFPSFMFPWT